MAASVLGSDRSRMIFELQCFSKGPENERQDFSKKFFEVSCGIVSLTYLDFASVEENGELPHIGGDVPSI